MRFTSGVRIEVGEFTVEAVLPRTLVVSSAGATSSYSDHDMTEGTEIVTWQGRRCGVVIGLESATAVLLDNSTLHSHAVTSLQRLRLLDYDPGGLHWLEFYEVDGVDVLLATEVGVSRISPRGQIVWQKVHDDLTVRPLDVDERAIWLEGEHGVFGYELQQGKFLLPAGA